MSYEVVFEPEVWTWFEALDEPSQKRVKRRVDRLAEEGPLLGEPLTRQLDGKLRELRFDLFERSMRITYWITPDRTIRLLTVFTKTRRRERREVERARRAFDRSRMGHEDGE
jgi:hypothetical protein